MPVGVPVDTLWRYLLELALGLVFLGLPLILWSFSLLRQVRARTQSLEQEIQEHRQTELVLRQRETQYRMLIEHSPDQIIRFNQTYQVVLANAAMLESLAGVYNWKKDGLEGKTFRQLGFPPADCDLWEQKIQTVFLTGNPQELEYAYQTPQGERVFGWKLILESDPAGQPEFVLGQGVDITQHKHAEQVLKESERRYHQMFLEHSASKLLIDPTTGDIVQANPAASKFYGYPLEVLQTMNIGQINLLPREAIASAMQATLKRERNYFLFQHRLASGEIRDVEVYSTPIRVEGRDLLYSIIHDITVRRRVEAQLSQSLERLNLATKAASLGIWDWDIQKNVLIWDDRMYELYGVKKGDFAEAYEAWLVTIHPDDRAASEEISRLARLGEREYDTEFRVIWPDGSIHVIKAFGKVIWDAGGNPIRMIGINYDITDRRQSEDALKLVMAEARQSQAEEEALLVAASSVLQQNDFDVTAHQIFDACQGLIKATSGYVALLTGVEFQAKVLFSQTEDQDFIGHMEASLPANHPGWVACSQMKVVFENDLTGGKSDPSFPPGHFLVNNMLFAPLAVDGKSLGLLALANKSGGFTENDARLALAFGEIASIALRNSRTMHQLQESEERYRSLFDNMTEAFALHELIYDDDGEPCDYRFLDVNRSFEELTGLKRENLIGRLQSYVLPAEDTYWLRTYGKVVMTGESVHIEHYSPVLQRHYQVFAYRPAPHQFATIFVDITTRKRVENALRESEEKFRLSLKNAPVTVAAQDADLKFLWVYNQQTVAPEFAIGKTDADVFAAGDAEKIIALKRKVLQTGQELSEQLWLSRGDQQQVCLDMFIEPIRDTDGHITGIGTATVDMTPIKQAERELKKSLEEKEMLLRELNHRTKNNLNIVNSLIQLQSESSENEQFRALAQTLEDRLHSIALVHDMLYRSRSLFEIDLAEYVSELVGNVAAGFMLAPGRIEVNIDAEPIRVGINTAIPCGQILNELISNAFKYAFPNNRKGRLDIYLHRERNGEILLRVSDNGVGFPKSYDESVSTSLGMSILHMLVRQLHGQIWLSTETGVTCEVRFKEERHS